MAKISTYLVLTNSSVLYPNIRIPKGGICFSPNVYYVYYIMTDAVVVCQLYSSVTVSGFGKGYIMIQMR